MQQIIDKIALSKVKYTCKKATAFMNDYREVRNMNCPNCGTANEHDSVFCAECGTKLTQPEVPVAAATPTPSLEATQVIPQPIPQPEPAPQPAPAPQSAPTPVADQPVTPRIPPEYKPMSPWAYFGWSLLYSIPFVGFVLLIVMSFAPRNKNHKNFTRSYWCGALIVLALVVVVLLLAFALGGGIEGIGYMLEDLF